MGDGERYFVENGKIYCRDNNEVHLVTCTVEEFLRQLEKEGYGNEVQTIR